MAKLVDEIVENKICTLLRNLTLIFFDLQPFLYAFEFEKENVMYSDNHITQFYKIKGLLFMKKTQI